DLCNLELDFKKQYAPVYKVPEDFLRSTGVPHVHKEEAIEHVRDARATDATEEQPAMAADEAYLRELCERGFEWRYGTREVSAEIRDRLNFEISVIAGKNFCSYFLIV